MQPRARPNASTSRWGIALAVVLALAPALAGTTDTTGPASRVPRPTFDAPQGEKCVANPDFMRRNHMKLLLHQRDDTVHTGVRPRETSLEGCIACHASKQTGSVIGSDRNFCQGCHAYAAVTLDCFECHAGKRQASGEGADRRQLVGVAR
jgi:hypothetical protein